MISGRKQQSLSLGWSRRSSGSTEPRLVKLRGRHCGNASVLAEGIQASSSGLIPPPISTEIAGIQVCRIRVSSGYLHWAPELLNPGWSCAWQKLRMCAFVAFFYAHDRIVAGHTAAIAQGTQQSCAGFAILQTFDKKNNI